MKNFIRIVFFLLLPVFSIGQVSDETPVWFYAELVGTQKPFSKKVEVEIDYGQDNGGYFSYKDDRIVDPNTGKAKSFNSMVDAMNFRSELGWEFVQAYVVTTNNQNVYRWLMRVQVRKDDKGQMVPLTKEELRKQKKE